MSNADAPASDLPVRTTRSSDSSDDHRGLSHAHVADDPTIRLYSVQLNDATFSETKPRTWVESHLEGDVLNACAGPTSLTHRGGTVVRNDVAPAIDADTRVDVHSLSDHFAADSFDTVIVDPPFSNAQARDTYDTAAVEFEAIIPEIDHVLTPGGTVLWWGFSTVAMPAERGYERTEIALWNNFGRQADWFSVVDEHRPGLDHDESRSRHADPAFNDTVQYNRGPTGDVPESDTQDTAINIAYYQVAPHHHPLAVPAVREWIGNQLAETDLLYSVYPLPDGIDLPHERVVDHRSLQDPPLDAGDPSHTLKPAHAIDCYDWGVYEDRTRVDAALLCPPRETFTANANGTGVLSTIRDDLLEYIVPGGKLIQLGPTLTCVPRSVDAEYVKTDAAIFANPATSTPPIWKDGDTIGVVEQRQPQGFGMFTRSAHEGTPDYDGAFECLYCGAGWQTYPPWRVVCPECGAGHRSHCLGGSDVSQPEQVSPDGAPIHQARIDEARQSLPRFGHCVASRDGDHDLRL